jgi:hypothetical protein
MSSIWITHHIMYECNIDCKIIILNALKKKNSKIKENALFIQIVV